MVTYQRIKELFDYDAETGKVTRLVCTANRHKVGETVGAMSGRGYLQATIDSKKYPLHRLIWLWQTGKWPTEYIDHINRDRTDNRFVNLREANHEQNCQNLSLGKRNTSGHMGVCWDKSRQLWAAHISHKGKLHHLGRFSDPIEAAEAYKSAKHIYHPFAAKDSA